MPIGQLSEGVVDRRERHLHTLLLFLMLRREERGGGAAESAAGPAAGQDQQARRGEEHSEVAIVVGHRVRPRLQPGRRTNLALKKVRAKTFSFCSRKTNPFGSSARPRSLLSLHTFLRVDQ